MPDPFRNYEGVPVVDLPADPPEPGTGGSQDWIEFLSRLLFYSASISAAKQAPSGMSYALRVNPSSGNLHPTEFHLACPNGLYHYRAASHMLEQRARGDYGPLRFLLTSIVWREAWKYQSRAYRYCLLDAGHAWQSLELAARALGCEVQATGDLDHGSLPEFGLPEDEWPMLLVDVRGGPDFPRGGAREWLGGAPNRLSEEVIRYPLIEALRTAPSRSRLSLESSDIDGARAVALVRVARRRRSALDFRGGDETIELDQLMTLLNVASPGQHVQLYLYVHRVRGLHPGVYLYWPDDARLELLKTGDQRVMAAALCLGQDLAGNSCVTFSMIGDLDQDYRCVHFEAGGIGQRLYLGAETLGFQSTGIGAFYDDAVHQYLEISPDSTRQVVYHFACGYAVDDERLVARDRDLLNLD
ncbi:MAG TPA: SagB/ThcOx family dehydrogenase [Bryobacteraceae bacterium]|nr:SagB/ThcOx family dehydrogenase [Bryobacteraceae bacterium]